jgi:hypothetical protein
MTFIDVRKERRRVLMAGLVVAIFFSQGASAETSYAAYKPPRATVTFSAGSAVYEYLPWTGSNIPAVTMTAALTHISGTFDFNGTPIPWERYVGHMATSGNLGSVTATLDGTHPSLLDLEAGDPYVGDPEKKFVTCQPVTVVWGSFASPPVEWGGAGVFGSRNYTSSTWTALSAFSGSITVSVKDNPASYADDGGDTYQWAGSSLPLSVFHVGLGSRLYWLNDAPICQTSLSVDNNSPQTGYFIWTVTNGSDKVKIYNSVTQNYVTILSGMNLYGVTLKSFGPSTTQNDVTVNLKWGPFDPSISNVQGNIINFKLTVWSPWMVFDSVTDSNLPTGYASDWTYRVKPKQAQTSNAVFLGLNVNEQWGNRVDVWIPNNWQTPAYVPTTTDNQGKFTDRLAFWGPWTPTPGWPWLPPDGQPNPNYNTWVFRLSNQVWRGGSLVSGQGIAMEDPKTMNFGICNGTRQ